jgi:hypothetical protein
MSTEPSEKNMACHIKARSTSQKLHLALPVRPGLSSG